MTTNIKCFKYCLLLISLISSLKKRVIDYSSIFFVCVCCMLMKNGWFHYFYFCKSTLLYLTYSIFCPVSNIYLEVILELMKCKKRTACMTSTLHFKLHFMVSIIFNGRWGSIWLNITAIAIQTIVHCTFSLKGKDTLYST